MAKEIINKIKRQPTEWKNIFTDTFDKGLISKIYKDLTNSTPKNLGKGPEWALLQREHTDGQ